MCQLQACAAQQQPSLPMTKPHFSPRDLLGMLAYAAVAAAMPEGATISAPDHSDPLQDLKGSIPSLLHPQQLQKRANPP